MAKVSKTVIGNVGGIYELRRVGPEKRAVIDFSVGVTLRQRDESGDWKDGDTVWTSVTAWGRLAENIEKSFKKGNRVFVAGDVRMKPGYTKDNGEEVPAREFLNADFAGLELTWDSAESSRQPRGSSSGDSAPAPAKKAAKKAAPKTQDDDFDLDLDDDFDLDPDDDDEIPF